MLTAPRRSAADRARSDGLLLAGLGAAVFLLLGFALEAAAPVTTADFKGVYYSARCLIEHGDPYQEAALGRFIQSHGGESPYETAANRITQRRYIYLPTAFILTAPFALLPFDIAHILWLLLTAGSFLLASYLTWELGASYAPVLAGALVGLTLANSELFLILGNPAGIAISLCAIAVWCFLRQRYVALGVVCMALSLMLKPHDAGLLWMCFLLSGPIHRRRALQTLALVVLLSIPVLYWVTSTAPHWSQGLSANLASYSAHGDISDPGPASSASHGIGMVISLQSVFSLMRDDPAFYNPAAYLIGACLFVAWLVRLGQFSNSRGVTKIEKGPVYLRKTALDRSGSPRTHWRTALTCSRRSQQEVLLSVAALSALTMLPVYHRIYDARLLLVAIPACAMLWAAGGAVARIAATLAAVQIVATGGIFWAVVLWCIRHLPASASSSLPIALAGVQMIPVPLILLATTVFYLCAPIDQAAD